MIRSLRCVPVVVLALVGGCANIEQQKVEPEVRTKTVEIRVPIPVPCFNASDKPELPLPTEVAENATEDQKEAAIIADAEKLRIYARLVDALFVGCMKTGGAQ